MSFTATFTQMSVLFLMVIIGYCANKLKFMDEEFSRRLSGLIIHVTSPFIILSSAMGDKLPSPDAVLPVLGAGTAALILMALLSYPLTALLRVVKAERGFYRFMFTFGNVSFIGFPVVGSLFGYEAIFYASLICVPFNILVFTVGLYFILSAKPHHPAEDVPAAAGSKPRRHPIFFLFRSLVSPALLATYITVILVILQLKVPHPVSEACTLVGSMTIPGSLLIIGSALADIPLKDMLGSVRLISMCVLKLLAVPAIFWGLFQLVELDPLYENVIIVLCGMPVAAYGTMFCLKNGLNATRIAQGTFWSTFLALFSIPLLSLML